MSRILIVYGTTEGHTEKIARRMAAAIERGGDSVQLMDSKDARKADIRDGYDGILVGGSVHAGEHQSSLREFVKENRAQLERIPSAFFSVSLSAAHADAEARGETQAVIDRFVRETGWKPHKVEAIAGALVYTQYNFFMRHLMRVIVKHEGRAELDTSRDYDFTDYPAVERFAEEFAASLAPLAVLAG